MLVTMETGRRGGGGDRHPLVNPLGRGHFHSRRGQGVEVGQGRVERSQHVLKPIKTTLGTLKSGWVPGGSQCRIRF